ncbi:MAG: hypothetical protein RL123_575 [Pseudomonadota bacterium]|jgi:16S rRNA (cytidine1402-2'-O)-methyltransferase
MLPAMARPTTPKPSTPPPPGAHRRARGVPRGVPAADAGPGGGTGGGTGGGPSIPPTPPGATIPPGLHLVAVPIGTARDITLRALDILAGADLLLAEDSRSLRHLMAIHGIALGGRRILAWHDHRAPATAAAVRRALEAGQSVAFCPEAGSPCISDPGHDLVAEAIAAGHRIHVAPGPSAALAALAIAGLPSERFLFLGFPPAREGALRRWIEGVAATPATLVIYESPRRVRRLLILLSEALGSERKAAICREITKRFEEVRRGTLGTLAAEAESLPERGEYVVLIDRARGASGGEDGDAEGAAAGSAAAALDAALRARAHLAPGAAATEAAQALGLPRKQAYARLMALRATQEGGA